MNAIGPVALGALTAGVWAFLGALRIAHHRLNRRSVIRQAEQVVRDAATQSRP